MESKFDWKYLKSNITFGTIAETFLHIVDFHFFQTSIQLASQPGVFIREYLKGKRNSQDPVSFYLSSLLFLFILYYLYEFLSPDVIEETTNDESSEYTQYWMTLPFIFTISGMNYLMFRKTKLNLVSNLVIATFIESQSVIYLTFFIISVDFFQVLNEPMTQALIYVLIIFGNIFAINFRTFQFSFFSTLWKSLLVILVAFIVIIVIAGIFF
ncbi:MAG: hypothetical protein RLO81_00855 [Fulvivirga sp.]|uniref:hypothetical protein n=1 Tax=Fulvivirga sp. TaxID=1931237 RepID=UPI0032F0466B